MVLGDKRVTLKEMSVKLGIEEASVCRILKQLGLKKVCAGWVPGALTMPTNKPLNAL
jgi:hypothetical protein